MLKDEILPFFEIEQTLSEHEKQELALFAQSPYLKKAKTKAAQLLALLPKAPEAPVDENQEDKREQAIKYKQLWLKRKIDPNSLNDRNFKRAVNQAEEIYWQFFTFRLLQKQEHLHLLLILENIYSNPWDNHFKSFLKKSEALLDSQKGKNAFHFLDYYRKEDAFRKFLAFRRPVKTVKNYRFDQAMEYLNQFFLLEKLKYAIFFLQIGKVQQIELPRHLYNELEYLCKHHEDLIEMTPVLKVHQMVYRIFQEGEKQSTINSLLIQLDTSSSSIPEEELKNLYEITYNLIISKINAADLSLGELKETYNELFEFYRLWDREDILKERNHISRQLVHNVVAAALNAGNILWAENFLENNIPFVDPDYQEDLKNFLRSAICFYKGGDLSNCRAMLRKVPNINRFYFCEIYSLEFRIHYELKDASEYDQINKIKRIIKRDKNISQVQSMCYLNFFDFLRQLFKIRELKLNETKESYKKKLLQLKTKIIETSFVAQKKWLLEKIHELE